jgi:hypothetical protein
MITSVFGKSSPINSLLIVLLLVLGFCIHQSQVVLHHFSALIILEKLGILAVLVATLFFSNFIVKKNNIIKDNSFMLLFFCVFVLFFSSIFESNHLVISNFFIVLALRRLISLQSLIVPKEKIFDASFWIFVATLFHFWSVLFLILVFVSIVFHVAGDYRNWFLPFIAFLSVLILTIFVDLVSGIPLISMVLDNAQVSFEFHYFENKMQSFALVYFLLIFSFLIAPFFFSYSKRTSQVQNSMKKVLLTWMIAFVIYLISPQKTNGLMILSIFPMAVFATSYMEYAKKDWFKEVIGVVIVLSGILIFVME